MGSHHDDDLRRWPNGLYGGTVVSKASLQKMTTPFKGDCGLGVYIRTIDGRRAATHGGGAPPFTNLTYFFDRGISVVVLGNVSVAPSAEIAGYLGALAHGDRIQLMSERKAITLASDGAGRSVLRAEQIQHGFAYSRELLWRTAVNRASSVPSATDAICRE